MPKEKKAKVIKLSDWHMKKKCNCFFCVSKCPECGSTDIEVKFKAGYEYEAAELSSLSNDVENTIGIMRVNDEIELSCNQCDALFEDSEFKSDERLVPLWRAIQATLNLPATTIVRLGKNGEITVRTGRPFEQD